ncbi:TB2/DP1, HVA22 family-domain-containing protein, partial [Endogone sp. FLAS-F59071]
PFFLRAQTNSLYIAAPRSSHHTSSFLPLRSQKLLLPFTFILNNLTMSQVDQINAKLGQYHAQLDKELSKHSWLSEIESKTKVPKVTLVLGVASTLFIAIFFNLAGDFLTDLIGWVYPAYASFKAIESQGRDDDKQWLTYWTVFGFIQIVEVFSDALVYWFPFYYLFKTLLVLWLALPQFRGAEILYSRFLRAQLLRFSPTIDNATHKIAKELDNTPKQD